MKHPTGGRRRWIVNLGLVVASVLTAAVVAELALRVAGIGHPTLGVPDARLGWSGRPFAVARRTDEGDVLVRMNSAGFRDRERAVTKATGTYRIAVVGDSFTEAQQVDLDKTFWSVAERELGACGTGAARHVEVLGFGVSGFGTAQELLLVETKVLDYHPDLVLLAFFQGNDVQNNSRALQRDPLRPYFVRRGDDLVEDAAFRSSPEHFRQRLAYGLVERSRLAQLVKRAVRAAEQRGDGIDRASHVIHEIPAEIYGEPVSPDWKEAWAVTEALLVRMRASVESRGARFAIATLSTGLQVLPDPARRARLAREAGALDLDYPDRRLARFADGHGIPICTLAPGLRRFAEERGIALHGFENAFPEAGHWNETGHRVAGELLAAWVCSRFLSPVPSAE